MGSEKGAKKGGLGGGTSTADMLTSPMGRIRVMKTRDGGRGGEGEREPTRGVWDGGPPPRTR